MDATKEGKGLRGTLRRWKDKWRTTQPGSSRLSILSAPTTRPSTNSSSVAPPLNSSLPPVPASPASPPPLPAALFTPTTETFIHSPADPRNRSRSGSISPVNTLKKPRPLTRRNTAPAEYLSSAAAHFSSPSTGDLPLNMVTTTIVAGNDSRRKRQSRFRLSMSKRGSVQPPPSSPSTPNFFDRSRSSSRATCRFEPLEERVARKRADSDRETLVEEDEVIRRDKPLALGEAEGRETIRIVEVTS